MENNLVVQLGVSIIAATFLIAYILFCSTINVIPNSPVSQIISNQLVKSSTPPTNAGNLTTETAPQSINLTRCTSELTSNKKEKGMATYGELNAKLCEEKNKVNRSIESSTDYCPRGGIVTMMPGGRLGNKIWEYASIWAISKQTKLEPYVPSCIHKEITELFENPSLMSLQEIADCPIPDNAKFVNNTREWTCANFSIIIPQYGFKKGEVFERWDGIRKELRFKKNLRQKAQKTLHGIVKKLPKKQYTFVGVHVRRTDYKRYLQRKFNRTLSTPDFFNHAMSYYRGKYQNCIFVYISDDPKWCFQKFGKVKNVAVPSYKKKSTLAEDMALMASCNHSIYDYGTFGLWGSVFAGGDTVYFNLLEENVAKVKSVRKNWIMMD